MARDQQVAAVTMGKPNFLGRASYQHDQPPSIGVLLVNLGTPEAPNSAAVRPYLRTFLSDPRVIEAPRALWWFILNLIILPFRAPKTATAYRAVWTAEGSPLLVISRQIRDCIAARLAAEPFTVVLGMSYSQPSISSALRELQRHNCQHIVVLPLYPQYAASTVGSVFDAVAKELTTWRWTPQLRFIAGYCGHPDYPRLLASSLRAHQAVHGVPQVTLFSFHGTPLSSLEAGDPYHCLCQRTAREAASLLALNSDSYLVSFQSRFGRNPWLQPYTIDLMSLLPQRGVTKLQVVCPAFAADCLETLEEIAGENRRAFLAAGGLEFSYVPALNNHPEHIEFLAKLIKEEAGSWPTTVRAAQDPAVAAACARRATATAPRTRTGTISEALKKPR